MLKPENTNNDNILQGGGGLGSPQLERVSAF